MTDENLITPYINWKGEYSYREIIPANVTFEYGNKFHGDSWLLPSVDVEKGQFRDFSFECLTKGIIFHTLMQVAEGKLSNTFDKTVDLIYENIKVKYKESKRDKE